MQIKYIFTSFRNCLAWWLLTHSSLDFPKRHRKAKKWKDKMEKAGKETWESYKWTHFVWLNKTQGNESICSDANGKNTCLQNASLLHLSRKGEQAAHVQSKWKTPPLRKWVVFQKKAVGCLYIKTGRVQPWRRKKASPHCHVSSINHIGKSTQA